MPKGLNAGRMARFVRDPDLRDLRQPDQAKTLPLARSLAPLSVVI
jgi:hypothetical protein